MINYFLLESLDRMQKLQYLHPKMSQKILCTLLAAFVWFQFTEGQTGNSMNDNPLLSGVQGDLVPKQSQDLGSGEALSKVSSASEIPPSSNPSPVENFISEFNSAVHTSKILPDIFDLRGLSPEAFSESLHNYVYAYSVEYAYSNPHHIASAVADPLKEGIDVFTLPIMLDIYGNTVAKYLFTKGALNATNASSLAKKFVKIMEDNAERVWVKERPESKFLAVEDGFVNYIKSVDLFKSDTFEDLAAHFAKEVRRVAAKL